MRGTGTERMIGRRAVVDWILIASILGAFIGGFFTPEETKQEVLQVIMTPDVNTTVEQKYPKIIITDM